MKKTALLCGLVSLSILFTGCSAKEKGKEVKLSLEDDYSNFGVTVSEFEDFLNYRLSNNYDNFKKTKMETNNGSRYSFDFNDDITIYVTEDDDNKVDTIELSFMAIEETEDNMESVTHDMGELTSIIFDGLLSSSDLNELVLDALDVYNKCTVDSKMNGSSVNSHLMNTLSYSSYDDFFFFSAEFEPTTYTDNATYQESQSFETFKRIYCPAEEDKDSEASNKNESTESYPSQGQASTQPAPTTKYYGPGMYKVGADIPAGEYNVKASTGKSGYLVLSSDPNGSDIITNDSFENNSYVAISDGQYLKLEDCYINQ
ncbi:hypothetical protein ACR75P_05045 [Faecalicoccus pleomorphus]|uniref:hypothetical protein n=1 Tax=Faecalicoccus pleomorphus TaxID=1323 RepID=UPI003DA1FE26